MLEFSCEWVAQYVTFTAELLSIAMFILKIPWLKLLARMTYVYINLYSGKK